MTRIIYGAGKYGQRLHEHFKTLGVKADFFAQTAEPVDRTLDGIPVISFEDMLRLDGDLIICMAIKDRAVSAEIADKIKQATIIRGELTVYDYVSFLDEQPILSSVTSKDGPRQCNICGNRFQNFKPSGIEEEVFTEHHVIGGGHRDNSVCPCCRAIDRERWQYHVLKEVLGIGKMTGRILHFAPEQHIRKLIRSNPNIDYYTGDIVPGRAMHVADITDLGQFADGAFDLVICNHVMEHIPDEAKAVAEIKRVLKNEGKWVFSFPICTDIAETYEDASITDPEGRLREYGQKDHVRLYGRDYLRRFEFYGLKITEYRPKDYFGKDDIARLGFIEDDVIMVAEKSV